MRKVVKDGLAEIERTGFSISSVKDKKAFLSKLANTLKEKKIGGWTEVKQIHLNSTIYTMYKSLVDMVNYE